MIKTVFFGTAEFARDILAALLATPDIRVELVITAPDKPAGRKQEIKKSEVKIFAEKNNIPVIQPDTLKQDFDATKLAEFDLAIACQYGFIIPPAILYTPRYHTLNIHPSLLPRDRGASPLQNVLVNGEEKTGTTIMLLDEEMDHGPILVQEEISIAPDDTIFSLRKKILPIAAHLIITAARDWVAGKIVPREQNHSAVTLCRPLTKEDGLVDCHKQTAREIYNRYRGYAEWPGIWTIWQNKRFKLTEIHPATLILQPGEIRAINKKLFVGTVTGALEILTIQPEGKKPLTAANFINGYQTFLP